LRLLVSQLGDLVLLGADLLVLAIRRRRRRALALLVPLEVRLRGARLLGDAVVLLGQELRVGRRRDVLLVLDVHPLLVVLALRRRGRLLLRHGRHRRRDDLGLGLGFRLLLLELGQLLLLVLRRLLLGRLLGLRSQLLQRRGIAGRLQRRQVLG